jgi:hypothetical protein
MSKTKEIILLLISLVAIPLFSFLFTYFNLHLKIDLDNFLKISDLLIILLTYTIIMVFVIYTKIKEVNEDIAEIRLEQKRLDEKIKIYKDIDYLKARVNLLEIRGKNGKN